MSSRECPGHFVSPHNKQNASYFFYKRKETRRQFNIFGAFQCYLRNTSEKQKDREFIHQFANRLYCKPETDPRQYYSALIMNNI